MNELPILRQLLVCEKLIIERDSNNVSLINCHSIRRAGRFPTPPISFAVYGLLTDGYGSFTIQLEITRLETADLIFRRMFPMTFADRLRGQDLACRISDLVLPAAGKYEILLSVNQELLGITSIELHER